jgi:hypothetical protein
VRPQGVIVFHELDLTTRIRSFPNGTLFDRMCDLMAETERRAGVWVDLGLHLANQFLNRGPRSKGSSQLEENLALLFIDGLRKLFALSCRPSSVLDWQARTSWISTPSRRECRPKLSRCELNSSVRSSLRHGLESLSNSSAE